MGIAVLPTAAQRSNQKSGVAIEKIQTEQAVGSYHLVDSYDAAIQLTGRIINHWLSIIDVGEGQKPVRLPDGKHKVVQINTDAAVKDGDHEYHFPIADDEGRYQVTISAGPSHESQREEGSEFADTLVSNLKNLPISPPQAAQILALVIRLKQLGPLGDQMADIISPQDDKGKQMAQMHQQMVQLQQQSQEQGALLQKLMLEKQGKVIEMQAKAQGQALQHQFDASEGDKDREVKVAVAEITTMAQNQQQRNELEADLDSQFHTQAHEVALQATQQNHEQALAASGAQQQSQLTAQQAGHQSDQSAQDSGQAQEQAVTNAALTPEPTQE
jgi:hypothetical protein